MKEKLIYAINIFIVASWCLLFFAWKSFKHKDKLNFHFFGDVNVSVNGNRDIKMYVQLKRVLLENQKHDNYFNI